MADTQRITQIVREVLQQPESNTQRFTHIVREYLYTYGNRVYHFPVETLISNKYPYNRIQHLYIETLISQDDQPSEFFPFGTEQIYKINIDNNNYIGISLINDDSGFKEVSEKMFISGKPISLMKKDGIYAIPVIIENNYNQSKELTCISGNFFTLNKKENKNILLTDIKKEQYELHEYATLYGFPISITKEKRIVCVNKQYDTYHEEDTILLESSHVLVRRINNNWYLTLTGV